MMPYEKSVIVPLSADETFALITEPDRLRRWQAITARVDLRAGGEYRWTIVPGHTARGTFTEVEPGRRVVFTWGWEGADDLPPGGSTVIITLEPAAGGTTVRLVHEGLTSEQEEMHAQGWNHYLGRLLDAAVKGDAGPDEWAGPPDEPGLITTATAALAACQRVLAGVTDADAGRATVCTEFTVAQLTDHLVRSITLLGGAAGAVFAPAAAGTLEERVAGPAQVALEAWDRRGPGGTVRIGENDMPAAVALGILSLELLVHGWDYAQATGQQLTAPDAVAAHVLELAGTIITPEGRVRAGFDPAVPAGPDAGVVDRLIAFTGRPQGSGRLSPA
jgi:uncharacterized protein (TIGR03086 family)